MAGRPPLVSYDEFQIAMRAIEQRGDKPTVEAAHREVGGLGSRSTMVQYLRRYRAEHGSSIGSSAAPIEVSRRLIAALQTEISAQVATATAALQEQSAEEQQTTDSLAMENRQLGRDLETAQETIEEQSCELAALRDRIERMAGELEAARHAENEQRQAAELARIEAARAQVDEQNVQASIDELRSKNEEFAGLLRSAERKAAEAQSEAAVHQAHRAELCSKVERLDREVARLQSLANSTEAELGRARAALLTSETKAARVDCQKQFIEALQKDLTNASKRIERLEKDLRNERRRHRASVGPKPAEMVGKRVAAAEGAGGRKTRQRSASHATRNDEPGTEVTTGGDTT